MIVFLRKLVNILNSSEILYNLQEMSKCYTMDIETKVPRGFLAFPRPNSSKEASIISVDFFIDYIKQV